MSSSPYNMNSFTKQECAKLLEELAADPKPNFLWYTLRANTICLREPPRKKSSDTAAVAVAYCCPAGWKSDGLIIAETLAAIQATMEKAYSLGPHAKKE